MFPSFVFQLFCAPPSFYSCASVHSNTFSETFHGRWTFANGKKTKHFFCVVIFHIHCSDCWCWWNGKHTNTNDTIRFTIHDSRYGWYYYVVLCFFFFRFLRQLHFSLAFFCIFIHNFKHSTFCHTFSFGGKSFSMLTLNTCSFFCLFFFGPF